MGNSSNLLIEIAFFLYLTIRRINERYFITNVRCYFDWSIMSSWYMPQKWTFPRKCINSRTIFSTWVGQVYSENTRCNCSMQQFIIVLGNLLMNILWLTIKRSSLAVSRMNLFWGHSNVFIYFLFWIYLKVTWILIGWHYREFIRI